MHRQLLLGVVVALAVCAGPAVSTSQEPPTAAEPDTSVALTDDQRRELERLATLGYLVGGDRAPDVEGVTITHPDACDGYTIYASRDYPGAFLVDMQGRILHSWREAESKNWTRLWVFPDGDVLAISSKPGRLIRLDRHSRLLWTYGELNLKAHHDLRVQPDGTIHVLTRRGRKIPWLAEEVGINDDMVSILTSDGESVREVDRISILEAFHVSDYADILFEPSLEKRDPLHANSIEVLDGRVKHPAFRSGNVLISMRSLNCLAVLDPDRREIVWVNRRRWQSQHEARVTPAGNILLFDNRTHDGQSRVVEYDVLDDEIVWSYTAPDFFSKGAGAQQLLPNDNILVTESQKGRIFEVTRDGRIVWEYISPRRIRGGRTIVHIPRAFRVPLDYFTGAFAEYVSSQSTSE